MSQPVLMKSQSSTSDVEVLKASYTWTINNFVFLLSNRSTKIRSSIFSIGENNEFKWRLRMYPNGYEEGLQSHLSLFLQLVSPPNAEVLVKFDFSIIKADGNKHTLVSHKMRNFTQWKSFGYHELIDKTHLLDESKGLLQGNNLEILCEMCIGTGSVTSQQTFEEPTEVHGEINLRRDLKALLKNKRFSDVTLVAGGERFQVHKAILSSRSPVFAAMFEHDMKEKNQTEIEIMDIDTKVMEQLIRFIYTGQVENIDGLANGLLAAADIYALDDLKLMCETSIYKNLTVDNAVATLVIADRHNSVTLKDQVIAFMKANAVRLVDNFTSLVLNPGISIFSKSSINF